MAGLPPLAGFLAKFAILASALGLDPGASGLARGYVWALMALVLVSGLAAILSLSRAGIRVFWTPDSYAPPRLRLIEVGPIALLLGVCVVTTVAAGPVSRYLDATAAALHTPTPYSQGVLSTPRVPSPSSEEAH